MNVMTRLMHSLPTYWEVFKSFIFPGSREESEDFEDSDEPPFKRRRMDDNFLLGVAKPEIPNTARHRMHHIYGEADSDDFLLCFRDKTTSYPLKLKKKSRLELPVAPHSGFNNVDIEKEGKENIICISDNENEDKKKSPSHPEEKSLKSGIKIIDLSKPEPRNTSPERATWLDARKACRVMGPEDARADKENDSHQLKVVAPSFLEKRIPVTSSAEFRAKMLSPPRQMSKPELSGGGASCSLKRPNTSSLSSLCSTSGSGRKLPLMDQSIRLDEREKYSELLQSFTRIPLKKHPAMQARRYKSPSVSLASNARKRFGNDVEVIDLTKQGEKKEDSTKMESTAENLGTEAAVLTEPTPSMELKKKLDKCNVYDVSWIEELTKLYSRKDRENRKRVLDEKLKAALCAQKSEQLLHEILEEKVRVHLRLTEVAVEEGPVPIAEDEEPLPELTPLMEKKIAYAFKSGPGGEVLAEAFSLRITRRDIHTLVGTNWLNDEVINFYMNLLIERGKLDNYPSVYCFNTFFYPKLESQGHASLKRWTRRVDVFANEFLIIPVHLGVHWCLACVNLKEKKILYYDSMGGKNNTCLQTLMKYLQDESVDKKKVRFETTGWSLENVKDNPQQMNGSDCGMFSCMYAEYICRRARITFSQSDMPYFRRKMAYEIISKKLML